jgi:hypothetical protein
MGASVDVEHRSIECLGWRISADWWMAHLQEIHIQLDSVKHIWEDYYTKDFMTAQILNEAWQAWGFGSDGKVRLLVITQIVVFPANRVLQILMALGNSLDECLPVMEATLERFANAAECGLCDAIGRPGWERKVPRFRRRAVLYSCSVPRHGVN